MGWAHSIIRHCTRRAQIIDRRQKQIENILRKEIDGIIRRELSDPDIGFFTITYVDISPDLKHARIGLSAMGSEEEKGRTFDRLNQSTGYIQHKLAGKLVIRYTPRIEFVYDERKEFRIEELLAELKRERDGKEGEGAD